MTLFLGVHKLMPEMKAKDIEEGFEKYKQKAKEAHLNPISAVYSIEKGFAYCQTEASSADEVKSAHEKAEIPLEDVIEVKKIT